MKLSELASPSAASYIAEHSLEGRTKWEKFNNLNLTR
jgi:hypothetical protein